MQDNRRKKIKERETVAAAASYMQKVFIRRNPKLMEKVNQLRRKLNIKKVKQCRAQGRRKQTEIINNESVMT